MRVVANANKRIFAIAPLSVLGREASIPAHAMTHTARTKRAAGQVSIVTRKSIALPNVKGQPRGDGGRAVFSDDKAGRGGLAPSRVAGPIPAVRCGDWFGTFFMEAKIIRRTPRRERIGRPQMLLKRRRYPKEPTFLSSRSLKVDQDFAHEHAPPRGAQRLQGLRRQEKSIV